jgi:hypothetical protein
MTNNDLLPPCPKARALLAALTTLEDAGIEATARFKWTATPPAWIDVIPSKAGAAQMSDLLPNEAKAIFEARQTLITAGMAITLQFEKAPFRIGIHPPLFPEESRLAAKEEIRLAVVAVLEYQLALGAADIAIAQAQGRKPDAPQQGNKYA